MGISPASILIQIQEGNTKLDSRVPGMSPVCTLTLALIFLLSSCLVLERVILIWFQLSNEGEVK